MAFDPDELTDRLAARDAALWPGATSADLSWLDAPRRIDRERRELRRWADSIDEEEILVLGIGPEVEAAGAIAHAAAVGAEWKGRRLTTAATTNPTALAELGFDEAFVLVMARSGREREARALFDFARHRRRDDDKIALISEAGSPLSRLGEDLRVRRVFATPPMPGGLSSLSYFGAVPAALCGYDLEEFCGRAMEIDRNAAVADGIALGEAALDGAPYLVLDDDDQTALLADLVISMLDATTVGGGRSVVATRAAGREVTDVGHRELHLGVVHEVASVISAWQLRAVIAAHVLAISPFRGSVDEESETRLTAILEAPPVPEATAADSDRLAALLEEHLAEGRWCALRCDLPGVDAPAVRAVEERLALAHPGAAVRAELAPASSFTSARQLHDGPQPVVVQVLAREAAPLATDEAAAFATLRRARLLAEEASLRAAGRTVLRVAVDDPDELA